jgi:hypothetical protein
LNKKATIVVSGMIAADPGQGGAAWAVLQYVLGLGLLGHEVYLIEPIQPGAIRPAGSPLASSSNADYFRRVMSEFSLWDRSALLLAGSRETFGMPYEKALQIARRSDMLINISGMLADETMMSSIPIRVYLDLDPAFNQLWNAVHGIDMRFAGHTHHVTIGQAIGDPGCPVPTCGLHWLKTWQPIVLDRWPRVERVTHDALTTVGNWRCGGTIEYQGALYGQKVHSMRQFQSLPAMTHEKFMLALAIHPDETPDLATLSANGWCLLDPARVADTPSNYQRFIQGSKAEFGIAKSGYVISRCGWFSDRSLCYLASGRPVVAQDTGFSRFLPAGEGLFAFESGEEVVEAVQALRKDYTRHAAAARALAEELFDSNRVLKRLLDQAGM